MDYTYAINQYDADGDAVDRGIFVDVGDVTTIKFQNSDELEKFCLRILSSLPEIRSFENH
jgi:hypothetical protein